MQLYIENISCAGCARGVTAIIQAIDPHASIDIDVAKKLVALQTTADLSAVLNALAEDDFPAQLR